VVRSKVATLKSAGDGGRADFCRQIIGWGESFLGGSYNGTTAMYGAWMDRSRWLVSSLLTFSGTRVSCRPHSGGCGACSTLTASLLAVLTKLFPRRCSRCTGWCANHAASREAPNTEPRRQNTTLLHETVLSVV